jgi:Pvc16 N-terminal domain
MSNHLAIATVTAVLRKTLQDQVAEEGFQVTTDRPDTLLRGSLERRVNVYLYQTALNPVWHQKADLRQRNRKGELATKSRTALDLHYMFSFVGDESRLEPQRLLGRVVRTLSDDTVITSAMIQRTLADEEFRFLNGSDLAAQVEDIRFTPMDLSLEDLSKVWSVFFQSPYTLSIAYKASVIIVDGEDLAQKSLPVRDHRFVGFAPFASQPIVEMVVSQAGKFEPILADSSLLILGKDLQGDQTRVRIGSVEVVPTQISDTQITLSAIQTLRSGVQSLQVIQGAIASNVAAFVLRPSIVEVAVLNSVNNGDHLYSASILLRVSPTIGARQRVMLILNEWTTDQPVTYLFQASDRTLDTETITIPIRDVKAADYLIRVQIDGAESLLFVEESDTDPVTSGWYTRPKITIG